MQNVYWYPADLVHKLGSDSCLLAVLLPLYRREHRSSVFCAGLKDRMNLCLFCLSLVDGMFVFVFSLFSSHCLVRLFRPDLETWWKWSVHSYTLGLVKGFLLCSGCLTMIISVERCVCVFLPLRATSLIRTRTMAVIVFTTIAMIQGICTIYPVKVCWTLLLLFALVLLLFRVYYYCLDLCFGYGQ